MTPAMALFRQELAAALAEAPATAGRRVVFGEGDDDHPRLCLIGEAPGAQEEAQGHPFVGKAGQNLNGFLHTLGLTREQLYLTNVVKVRPFRVSAKGTVANRPPNRAELALCQPWLQRELALVRPRLLVTLGNTALHAVAGDALTIGDCHGQLRTAESGIPLVPLYHPAAIIYNRSLSEVYEADLLQLKGILAEMEASASTSRK